MDKQTKQKWLCISCGKYEKMRYNGHKTDDAFVAVCTTCGQKHEILKAKEAK